MNYPAKKFKSTRYFFDIILKGKMMGWFKNLFKKKEKNNRYISGLSKTRDSLATLKDILKKSSKIDDELFETIEEIFINSDIGIDTTIYLVEQLRSYVKEQPLTTSTDLAEIIVDKIFDVYLSSKVISLDLNIASFGPTVYLFVGVNGTGKTTSIAKMGYQLKAKGSKVLMVAADTFRAGAIEQLSAWGEKTKIEVFKKADGSDPSSVIYEALIKAKNEKFDYVLIDTAGRLQTKVNLMNELNKMYRVIKKVLPEEPSETLLVIDATTGQNGINQAFTFNEAATLTGIILTKLDGTAKGGIVLAIKHLYNIPIKLVGLGEKVDDLVAFDIEDYVYSLFKDFF
ncbi:MAG: signal recognition particle-docking protein FtsY [Acholeplasmatales bacterium]|jgi:fused signal recognition particle receptor|nr:signal recognition particle-docking protein FtsY [Acholeplasmatales bacterium]